MVLSEYQERVDKCVNDLINYFNSTDWSAPVVHNGITVSTKIVPDTMGYVRGEKTLTFSLKEMITVHQDIKVRREWDHSIDQEEIIQQDADSELYWVLYKTPSRIIWQRDFVQFRTHMVKQVDGKQYLVVTYINADHPSHPPKTDKYVRGILLDGSGWLVDLGKAGDPIDYDAVKEYKTTYIIGVDPAGSVPAFAVKTSQSSQANRLNDIEAVLTKRRS